MDLCTSAQRLNSALDRIFNDQVFVSSLKTECGYWNQVSARIVVSPWLILVMTFCPATILGAELIPSNKATVFSSPRHLLVETAKSIENDEVLSEKALGEPEAEEQDDEGEE